jgi:hypothetical protein
MIKRMYGIGPLHCPVGRPASLSCPSSCAAFEISTLSLCTSSLRNIVSCSSVRGCAYGWILSTHRGERVAEGMGPARGRRVHSYRAEACGILSFLRFLIRISNFTQMHDQWQGVLATDSQSVLDTLFGRDSEQPNNETSAQLDRDQVELDPLCPEWDVLIEIQAALRELPRVQLQYVAGHQDKQKTYNTLSLLEQLNVDADRIAAEYHELHHPRMPYVLLSPNTRAHLLFRTGQSLRNTTIQSAFRRRPLR